MKKTVGFILFLVGAGVVVLGGYMALRPLAGLYDATLKDPLAEPENPAQGTQSAMIPGLIVGAAGVPVLLTGSILMKSARRRPRS